MIKELLDQKKKIILFDGVCNLCNWWVRFLIRHDSHDTFRFAPFQSDIGNALQVAYNIDSLDLDSVIVIDSHTSYATKSNAILSVVRSMGGAWPVLSVFWILPKCIRDWIYDSVARNRYHWFGKQKTCMVPTDEVQHKFLTYV